MLWSSFGDKGYTVGIARSETGRVEGPWKQDPKPLHQGGGYVEKPRLFRLDDPHG